MYCIKALRFDKCVDEIRQDVRLCIWASKTAAAKSVHSCIVLYFCPMKPTCNDRETNKYGDIFNEIEPEVTGREYTRTSTDGGSPIIA